MITIKNGLIVTSICLFVTMLASGISIASLKNQVAELEEFKTKVDSVYMPNVNRELLSGRNIDFWFERTFTAIDSTTLDLKRREVVKLLQAQNQVKK